MKRVATLGSAAIAVSVFAFYWWTATSSPDPTYSPDENSTVGTGRYYNLLANGLRSGHLYLPVAPSPELLALSNPYDPALNRGLRLHDASLYQGHYYLYFGVAPAVTLFLPWKIVTGSSLLQNHASAILLCTGYLFSLLLLEALLRQMRPRLPGFLYPLMAAAAGLAQIAPIMARRTMAVYEVPIAAAYCFFVGALYFLARRTGGSRTPGPDAWLAGILLGLAIGSRPHYVLAAAVLAGFDLFLLYGRRGLRGGKLVRHFAQFAVPLAVCCLLLAAYNFARFDNPFEFGTRYQLTAQAGNVVGPKLTNLAAGLYYYLVQGPSWVNQFPYLYLHSPGPPFGNRAWLSSAFRDEVMIGLIWISPLCVVGALFPFWNVRRHLTSGSSLDLFAVAMVCSTIPLFLFVCCLPNLALRYDVDFAPTLLAAALFFLCRLIAYDALPRLRQAAIAILALGCIWGALAGAALSINSYDAALKLRNPEAFKKLVAFFGGDPEALLYQIGELYLDAEIVPAASPRTFREALLTTGLPGQADFVFLEHTGVGRIRFGYLHQGSNPIYSPDLEFLAGQPANFSVAYRWSLDDPQLKVALNGSEVFNCAAKPYFTSARDIRVGPNVVQSDVQAGPFWGVLRVKRLDFGVK